MHQAVGLCCSRNCMLPTQHVPKGAMPTSHLRTSPLLQCSCARMIDMTDIYIEDKLTAGWIVSGMCHHGLRLGQALPCRQPLGQQAMLDSDQHRLLGPFQCCAPQKTPRHAMATETSDAFRIAGALLRYSRTDMDTDMDIQPATLVTD